MRVPEWHYLTRGDICALRKVGRTRQYEDEKAGRFPPGERHGMRTIRWRSDVVAAWLEADSARAQGDSESLLRRQSESARAGVEAKRAKHAKRHSAALAGQE